jgi:hypothetical protein
MTVDFCPVEVAFRQPKRNTCKDQMNVKDVNQCTVFWNKMIKGPDEKIMFSLFYTGIKRKYLNNGLQLTYMYCLFSVRSRQQRVFMALFFHCPYLQWSTTNMFIYFCMAAGDTNINKGGLGSH